MEGAPALPTGEGLVYSVETNSVSKGQVKLNVSQTYTGLKEKGPAYNQVATRLFRFT